MRPLLGLVLVSLLLSVSFVSVYGVSDLKQTIEKKNKFRERQASDDTLAYPNLDEDSLLNTKCPHNLELRWQTEVSSSIYATPLIADINSDGKLEVVVPSFVHYLEVLEGSDGDKFPGWPAFHQSMVHSSPLLFDIDKDGTREIALATFNGIIHFFRSSGYLMMDKLEVPRRKVRKDWYVGLRPDPVDRSHPDVHDNLIVKGASGVTENKSNASSLPKQNSNSSKTSAKEYEEKLVSTQTNSESQHIGQANSQDNNITMHNVLLENNGTENKTLHVLLKSPENVNSSAHNASLGNITSENSTHTQRRLLQDSGQQGIFESHGNDGVESHEATVKNDGNLEDDADQSFDLFRDAEDLSDEYNYDYDDYVDESLWGDEEWTEEKHEKLEDYVNVDSHILCTPVIADIDNDGVQEMIVSATYFFDREYYDNPEHLAELGGIDISNYIASSIVVFNLDTKQVKWTAELDLSTDSGNFRAYMYTSPTVIDLDGDGNLDILVGTSYGLVYALDHRGMVRTNFPLEMAEIQSQVVAADINDDGKIEILTSDAHGNVAAWTAEGKEIWEAHIKSLIPQGPTIGDVDGDGHTDVVIPTVSGNIYVLSGRDGSFLRPFPYRTRGRVMNRVLLVDLSKRGEKKKGLTLVTTSFDGYLYLIDGSTACADVVDIGETSYSMVLADNIDGGEDLDLVVSTMNGNVYCFSTSSPHHPMKEWRSSNQGRNNPGVRHEHEGVYISQSSRSFRDEEGKYFWVEFEIIDKYRVPSGFQGPYNVTMNLLVPGNYQGERRIVFNQVYNEPGKQRMKLPTVPVRTTGTVFVEMVDRNGVYFYDEFSLTFHMHYYKLLKWLLLLPLLGMFGILVILRPHEGSPLPSYSRNRD